MVVVQAFPNSLHLYSNSSYSVYLHTRTVSVSDLRFIRNPNPSPNLTYRRRRCSFASALTCSSSDNGSSNTTISDDASNDNDTDNLSDDEIDNTDIEIEIEKTSKNRRRIRSKVFVKASLQTVWEVLTDYEGLADFIPGLAVSQLLQKEPKFARVFQVGEQNLAFGLKFNAKGIVDCYEKDLETLPFGQRRDIEFKMVEGDFQLFEGKWSIEQLNTASAEEWNSEVDQPFHTYLSYVVDVEPKLWLPVRIIEGRLCKEIKINVWSVRDESQKRYQSTLSSH